MIVVDGSLRRAAGLTAVKLAIMSMSMSMNTRVVRAQSVLRAKFLKSGSTNYVSALYKTNSKKIPLMPVRAYGWEAAPTRPTGENVKL